MDASHRWPWSVEAADPFASRRRDLHNNAAQACITLERWEEAVQCATAALEAEPANAKALYRRAVALLASTEPAKAAQAKPDLLEVCRQQPNNSAARKLLARLDGAHEAPASA